LDCFFACCCIVFNFKIGTHGIRVSLNLGHHQHYGATYLPDVMSKRNWNHKESIESCLRKGGFPSKLTDQLLEQVQVTRYQTSKCHMTYDEYQVWKKTNL
jgi:AMMECR1 domain-containing protein